MKSLLGRKLANSVNSVGSMILFLLFAACSLVMIAVGAATYSRISDSFSDTFSSSAAVRYVTNKIRSGERAEVGADGGISVYTGGIVCVISNGDGGVGERNAKADSVDSGVEGDIIFPGTVIEIEESGGLFIITAKSGNDVCTGYCREKG